MEPGTAIALITVVALIGIGATIFILGRRDREASESAESPYAASSEGMTGCRHCGRANLVTDENCIYCGTPLVHHEDVG